MVIGACVACHSVPSSVLIHYSVIDEKLHVDVIIIGCLKYRSFGCISYLCYLQHFVAPLAALTELASVVVLVAP